MTAAEIQERLVCILNNNQFTKVDKKAMGKIKRRTDKNGSKTNS